MRRAPVRLLMVLGGALLGLTGIWWSSGVSRARAAIEVVGAPEERDAARALAPILVHDRQVLEAVQAVLGPERSLAALDEAITVSPAPPPGETLRVELEARPGEVLGPAVGALARELSNRVALALPDLRRSRLETLRGRLRILEASLRGRGAAEEEGPDLRALFEVERSEALEELGRVEEALASPDAAGEDRRLGLESRRHELRRRIESLDDLLVGIEVRRTGTRNPVLEVRDRLARQYSEWLVQDRAPARPLRLLSDQVHIERIREPVLVHLLAFLTLGLLFVGLELVARPDVLEAAGLLTAAAEERREEEARRRTEEETRAAKEVAGAAEAPPRAAAASGEDELPLLVLGTVRRFPAVDPGQPDRTLLPREPRGGMPEPFPGLVARLTLRLSRGSASREDPHAGPPAPRLIQVCGFRPGVGASLVAINLARGFAGPGREVVLVDANLRRPRIHQVYQLENLEGVSDLLVDRTLEGLVHPGQDGEPDLVLAGPVPPSPEELLASPRLEELLRTLSDTADVVVVDGPSMAEGGDALLLASVMDGTLLVVPDSVGLEELADRVVELGRLEVPLLGMVVVEEAVP